MRMLARWSRTEPNTCLDTSKNQIFIGLRGDSLHLLNASEDTASRPSRPWTSRAKSPSRLHSPLPLSLSMGLTFPAASSTGLASSSIDTGLPEGSSGGASSSSAFTVSSSSSGVGSAAAGAGVGVGSGVGVGFSFGGALSMGTGSDLTPSIPNSSVSKTANNVRNNPHPSRDRMTYLMSNPEESRRCDYCHRP